MEKEYDDLRASGDDIQIVGEELTEKHYCRMYDNAIDDKIISGKKQCKDYRSIY